MDCSKISNQPCSASARPAAKRQDHSCAAPRRPKEPVMDNQKNTILAVVLSGLVLLAWQYFIATPQLEKQRQIAQEQAAKTSPTTPTTPTTAPQQQPQQAPGAPQPPAQSGATPPATTTA